MCSEIKFVDRILDNVHGFIYYTDAEKEIINTLLFKRLQSIKQLSIVNWVFPGSEHTRYIHSLGVMYIADKIAVQLKLSTEERKIIRMAGLLHDIGHYPLSHVCEFPYKKNIESFHDEDFCKNINHINKIAIEQLDDEVVDDFMVKSQGYHHERMGAHIVCNNKKIKEIIVNECGEGAPEIIADIITGNTERKNTNPLYVQILHSELDADGIDYLMRDAVFSGTSFGSFELDQLIGCMEQGEYDNKKILCITPKGIAAADQYLINKFFSYSQVVYNKHISITEFMAEQIVNWMQKNNAFFPQSKTLEEWVKSSSDNSNYVRFTDNYFWASLQNILTNALKDTEPKVIRHFSEKLLSHTELEYEDNSEVKIVSNKLQDIKDRLTSSNTYQRLDNYNSTITIFNKKSMSKQIPEEQYETIIKNRIRQYNDKPDESQSLEDIIPDLKARRYMECICVKDGRDIHLLCDDYRSLMQQLYNTNLVLLRAYKLGL